jgi:ketosteroid isomerase-like protein
MKKIAEENNARLEKSFLAGNVDSLIQMYSPDARLCPNGDTFYVGRDAIYNFWKADMASSVTLAMHTNTMSVSGNTDVIYETGITHVESKSKSDTVITKSAVKFINVWKRQPDNSYKLAIDFWNSLGR